MAPQLATRAFAALISAALLFSGVIHPQAQAQSSPSVTVAQAPIAGGDVTITGQGFDTTGPGVYVAVAPSTVTDFYGNSDSFVGGESHWIYTPSMAEMAGDLAGAIPMEPNGTFDISMPVPAAEDGKDYVVLTTKAHGIGKTDKSQDLRIPVRYVGAEPTETRCQSKTYLELEDSSLLADPSIVWGVNRLFLDYAQGQGYTMSTVDAWPQGAERIAFDRNGKSELNGTTLSALYDGKVKFDKDGNTHFSITSPRVEINDPNSADVYLTIHDHITAGATPTEVRIGRARGPIYLAQDPRSGYEILHMLNAPVELDPLAAGALPGLSVNSTIPPISFRIDLLDRNQSDPVGFYSNFIDMNEGCALLPWMTQWLHVDEPDITPVAPTPIAPPAPMPIAEENALWNESEVNAAPAGELHWGIKESWRRYIGGAELSEGARFEGNSYVFPEGTLERNDDGTSTITYWGKIHFEAYGGALYLTFSDPQVRIAADGTSTLWMKQWNRANGYGPEIDDGYFPAISITEPAVQANDTLQATNSETYLTEELATIFIFAYREGLRMSNLSYAVASPQPTTEPSTEQPSTVETTTEQPEVEEPGDSSSQSATARIVMIYAAALPGAIAMFFAGNASVMLDLFAPAISILNKLGLSF